MFLEVQPPSRNFRQEDVVYIDLDRHPIDDLELFQRLNRGSFDWEDLDNEAIANHPDPGTEQGREQTMQAIHERNSRKIVELLNFVMHVSGKEVSEDSTFGLVESPPVQVGDTVITTKIIYTEGTRISDGEIGDVFLARRDHYTVVAVGNQYSGGEVCVQIDNRQGFHVWLDADDFEKV